MSISNSTLNIHTSISDKCTYKVSITFRFKSLSIYLIYKKEKKKTTDAVTLKKHNPTETNIKLNYPTNSLRENVINEEKVVLLNLHLLII